MRRFLHNMLIVPEKTFPFLQSRAAAYFTLYVLPGYLLVSMFSATITYGSAYLAWAILFVAIVYVTVISYKGIKMMHEQQSLKSAQTQELPGELESYFKAQPPVTNMPMMLSDDRMHWVVYDHIDKYEMARLMTHLDYHLMPPPPESTDYFMKNVHKIEHAWLTIESAEDQKFRISSTKSHNPRRPSYPVTVFDRSEQL